MKVFKVWVDDSSYKYDAFDGAVVVAESEEDVRSHLVHDDELEELKLVYEKADAEFREACGTYRAKLEEKNIARREYERELFKNENCGTCKYGVISDIDPIAGDHNVCGCEDAPCTCCNCWCENYQPDTPLTKEAIDVLQATFSDTCSSRLKEAVNKAIEALEDTLPKKPIEDKGNRITDFKCPRCKSMIAYKVDENFMLSTLLGNHICRYCGQEIDWSEVKEE